MSIANNSTIPPASPLLARWMSCYSLLFVVLVFLIQFISPIFVIDFTEPYGLNLYLALVGVSATLAGFVIAAIAIMSTILAKPEFLKSQLKSYYVQMYNSMKSSISILVAVIIFGTMASILPKDNIASVLIFHITLYLFFSSLIIIGYATNIISSVLAIDSNDVMSRIVSDEISFTDTDTQENGPL